MLTIEELTAAIPHTLDTVDLPVDLPDGGAKQTGKVRDIYCPPHRPAERLLITTDRVSAFDRVLGTIPFKGQVLNQLSAWWFEHVSDIVQNHVIAVPDPNVMIVREASVLPVEVVVRGYITGVTKTSLWYLYEQGERTPYGIPLPDGLQKNDPLPSPIITPTTKAMDGGHDERLTREELLERGFVAPALWEEVERVALALFRRGQEVAAQAGLILVDTKYEFGLIGEQLVLIDEIHTPDSSRYWTRDSYAPPAPPESFDKEYLRLWYAEQGYRGDGDPPTMPSSFIATVASRYIAAYEHMTGTGFEPGSQPAQQRIKAWFEEWRGQA
jgi:phosphoribosylaminoimidazole-succinocarboxamide synthase